MISITLTKDQAHAVAAWAADVGGPVGVGFRTDCQAGPGLYVWRAPDPSRRRSGSGTPSPLFAPDMDRPRDFAVERLGMRDAEGWVAHPDMDGISENEEPFPPTLRALGFECNIVSMEGDVPDEELQRFYDTSNCLDWKPTPPEGAGWLLAQIYDTEDGPQALFVRKAVCA